MAYSSKINIRLGEVPHTTDGETFADFIDVYNAIHILAQYTADISNRFNPDNDTPPWESMTFTNIMWLQAGQKIKSGDMIHVHSTGVRLGVSRGSVTPQVKYDTITSGMPNGPDTTQHIPKRITGLTLSEAERTIGMALSDAEAGELVKVGLGQAVINMEGVNRGDIIYAVSALEYKYSAPAGFSSGLFPPREANDGGLYKNVANYFAEQPFIPRWAKMFVEVGHGVAPDATLIYAPGYNPLRTKARDIEWAL